MNKLKLLVAGHVDHGKSTLVARLLHEMNALPKGKLNAVRRMSDKRGMPFEWATQIRFKTAHREYVLIDAPGHKEFLKNMVSGTANVDAVVFVVDAQKGVQDQTRRHAYLLRLLGIRKILVVISKMDLVDYREERFQEVRRDIGAYLRSIGIDIADIGFVPVVARDGDNLRERSESMPWYQGQTLVGSLDALPQPAAAVDLPLRMPVQDVYKFDDRRIIAGRIESGRLNVGDAVLFSPSNKTAHVASIEAWNVPQPHARASAGQSVGFTLDEQIFVERGQLVSHVQSAPIITNVFRARIFWLGQRPLVAGTQYRLRHGASETKALIERVERVIDVNDLSSVSGERIGKNAVAEVTIRTRGLLAVDDHSDNPLTGRFVLIDGHQIGRGIISTGGYPDQRVQVAPKSKNLATVQHRVSAHDRARVNGHRGAILWFTGLSGSGKSTLAVELERQLFAKGYQVCLLDGDNVRQGLSADLGFSPQDRAENIRRIGEVARLLAEAGMVAITAFISPYRCDRDRIRAAHAEFFNEVYIDAPLEVCESRDTKGLYRKARAGLIKDFTGVSAPYEPPVAPELVISTAKSRVDDCLAQLLTYVEARFSAVQRRKLESASPFLAGSLRRTVAPLAAGIVPPAVRR